MTDSGVKKEERAVNTERRRASRLQEDNDVTITIISEEIHLPKERTFYNLSKDISVSGIRIQTSIYLPINTHLEIKITLKDPPQIITAFAKVIWIQGLSEFDFYESGLEFVNTSNEMIQQLEHYISSKF
jgi:c-di-GMP-binding flagellar brake protein YcgR